MPNSSFVCTCTLLSCMSNGFQNALVQGVDQIKRVVVGGVGDVQATEYWLSHIYLSYQYRHAGSGRNGPQIALITLQ